MLLISASVTIPKGVTHNICILLESTPFVRSQSLCFGVAFPRLLPTHLYHFECDMK